jgi:hypothetical protein
MKCHEIFLLMRLHAFGSLCGFLMIFLRLDGKLSDQISCFFAVVNEVFFWDFMLFVTKFVLIYVSTSSPPWTASKSIRIFLRTTCWT